MLGIFGGKVGRMWGVGRMWQGCGEVVGRMLILSPSIPHKFSVLQLYNSTRAGGCSFLFVLRVYFKVTKAAWTQKVHHHHANQIRRVHKEKDRGDAQTAAIMED